MRAGEAGEVVDIVGAEDLIARLAENGLRKGSRLELLSAGNPSLFKVNETKLTFRGDGQVEVMVCLAGA